MNKHNSFIQGTMGFITIWDKCDDPLTVEPNFDNIKEKFKCLIQAEDIGSDTGEHHWHYFFHSTKRYRRKQIQELIYPLAPHLVIVGKIHDLKATFKYLDDKREMGLVWLEWGSRPMTKTGGNNFNEAAELIKKYTSWEELTSDPKLYPYIAKFKQWVKMMFDKNFKFNIENMKLRKWQDKLDQIVCEKCQDDRTIHWYYDEHGGMGKSTMTRYLISKYNAQQLSGSFKDIAYEWDRRPIAIFDIPKNYDKNFYPYGAMEALKNGFISSSKYESTTKIFPTPHVIVFSNDLPDENKFSSGRVKVHKLKKQKENKKKIEIIEEGK